MPYPVIPSRRIPYDIDGTAVGYNTTTDYAAGPVSWFLSAQLGEMNDEDLTSIFHAYAWRRTFYFFFPEKREITHMFVQTYGGKDVTWYGLEGSNDSPDGIGGTWETAVMNTPIVRSSSNNIAWRNNIVPVSFSEPKKTIRCRIYQDTLSSGGDLYIVHLYGMKYSTETPDDLLFVDASTGAELTSLTDWGDRPEGTTVFKQMKVKNASTTKTANNINLQLNHDDFLISWNAGGPWTTVLDITSLGAGAESATIHIKNELGPPNLVLLPKAGRIIATVGSWT